MASFGASMAQLVGAARFDAEYFRPEFVESAARLSQVSSVPLPALAQVSDGNHLSISHAFTNQAEENYRYLRGQDVGQFFLGARKPVYIPEAEYSRLERSHIRPGDVLLSIVGTVGALSLVPEDSPPMTASCKLAILRPRSWVPPEYLAAFLASQLGQSQIRRLTRGAVQTGLILADMKHVRIPRLGQLEVEVARDVSAAYRDLRNAHTSLREALDWLPQEWGLQQGISDGRSRSFAATLSHVRAARRSDAEYFRPEYAAHQAHVLNLRKSRVTGMTRVGRLLTKLTNGHTPRHHDLSHGDVRFLTAEHIVDFRPDFWSAKRITTAQHNTELARTRLAQGDILFTIKGRVGDVAPIASPPPFPANVNQDVAVLRLKDGVDPYFFAAWFNSRLGRPFIDQAVTGAINPFIALSTLVRLPFPEVDDGYQREAGAEVQRRVTEALRDEGEAAERLQGAIERIDAALFL